MNAKVYKAQWTILDGLQIDKQCDISEHIMKNMNDGMFHDKHTVYYIQSARHNALGALRTHITNFMSQCIDEHEQVLKRARDDWKLCK